MVDCSIIVPTYNRPIQLDRCLKALMAQQNVEFEIVVVDDGSTEAMAPICEAHGPTVRCIRQENAGPATARNTGASAARGEFLAFTDDDCCPRPPWLATLKAAHGGVATRMVGGHVVNGLPKDRYATASQALCDFLYDYFGAADGNVPFFTSNNLGLARAGFERLGGFDETFPLAAAEDRDFGMRWRELGGKMVYVENSTIDHYHHLSLTRFWRQHEGYGAGAAHLHRIMNARDASTPRIEPARFYWRLLTWPIRQHSLLRLDLAALLFLSQCAMVAGYAGEVRRRR